LREIGGDLKFMRLAPGRARAIGALLMEDETGVDEKIIAMLSDELRSCHRRLMTYRPNLDRADRAFLREL
jgi:hypothetical protein